MIDKKATIVCKETSKKLFSIWTYYLADADDVPLILEVIYPSEQQYLTSAPIGVWKADIKESV